MLRNIDEIAQNILNKKLPVHIIATYDNGKMNEGVLTSIGSPLNCFSISKTFIATAVGIMEKDGVISVDDGIADIFADEIKSMNVPENLKKVKVKHFLTQTVGIDKGFLYESDRYTYAEKNWLKLCLEAPLPYEPGEHFEYSNTNSYVLSRVIAKLTGEDAEMFLKKRCFPKLGIENIAWERCPEGYSLGSTGMYLYTFDMAKLGILYIEKGLGIVTEDYIARATTDQVCREGQAKYGYGIWIDNGCYVFNGAGGQFVVVFPEEKYIFACHGCGDYSWKDILT
jgi:CubicO group peptidase (beta-lactamase class C family)